MTDDRRAQQDADLHPPAPAFSNNPLFPLPSLQVDEFVARVDCGSNVSVCHTTGNCCSLSGSQGVEYELGMRWQVRSEWPVEGKYAAL